MRLVHVLAFTLLLPGFAAANGHGGGGGGGGGGTTTQAGCGGGGSASTDDTCLLWEKVDGGPDAGDLMDAGPSDAGAPDGGPGDAGSSYDLGHSVDMGSHPGMICVAHAQPVGCSTGRRPIAATWLPIGFAISALLFSTRRRRRHA